MIDFEKLESASKNASIDFQKNNQSRTTKQVDDVQSVLLSDDDVEKINSKMRGNVRLTGGSIDEIAKCCQSLFNVINEETKDDDVKS